MFVARTHDKPYLRLMQLILFNVAPFFMVPKGAGVESIRSGIKSIVLYKIKRGILKG